MVQVEVAGPSGGTWHLERGPAAWHPGPATAAPAAKIVLDPATARQLFAKGLAAHKARARVLVTGDEELVRPLLHFVAVLTQKAAGGPQPGRPRTA